MDPNDFSRGELIRILEVIEGARNSVTSEHLRKVILQARELVSADRTICGVAKVSAGEVEEIVSVVNGNYPHGWLSSYLAEKMYYTDPIVRFHTQYSLTQFWSDIFKTSTDSGSRAAIEHAADFGLRHGISSGIYVPESGSLGILAFAGDQNRFSDRHKKIMDIISLHINNALVRTACGVYSPARAPLLDQKTVLP